MKLIEIYKCLCDETRLRILNLLAFSPLCVCHVQEVLDKSQVIVSQHLTYLRDRGMVEGRRHRNWMIYSLPANPPVELAVNLKCLQDCVQEEPIFQSDRKALQKLFRTHAVQNLLEEGCCVSPVLKTPTVAFRRGSAKKKVNPSN